MDNLEPIQVMMQVAGLFSRLGVRTMPFPATELSRKIPADQTRILIKELLFYLSEFPHGKYSKQYNMLVNKYFETFGESRKVV